MIVGPIQWRTVSTDHFGVPHGGTYGNVAWAEKELARHGLKLCWSTLYRCFGIYLMFHGEHFWQMTLKRPVSIAGGKPIALTRELVQFLAGLKEQHCRHNRKTLREAINQSLEDGRRKEAELKYKMTCELRRELQDRLSGPMGARKVYPSAWFTSSSVPKRSAKSGRIITVGRG